MNFKINLLTFLFFLFSFSIVAQQEITISGQVLDNDTKQPLEYATIVFSSPKDKSIITGGITGVDGKFIVFLLNISLM